MNASHLLYPCSLVQNSSTAILNFLGRRLIRLDEITILIINIDGVCEFVREGWLLAALIFLVVCSSYRVVSFFSPSQKVDCHVVCDSSNSRPLSSLLQPPDLHRPCKHSTSARFSSAPSLVYCSDDPDHELANDCFAKKKKANEIPKLNNTQTTSRVPTAVC